MARIGMRKRRWLSIALLVALSTSLGALEYSKGRIKVVLDENIGRFSLYYLSDLKNKVYVPLFSDEDPRTTLLQVLEGNAIHRIGDSYEFKTKAEIYGPGVRYIWESSRLQITEEFIPIASPAAPLEDGVKLRLVVENISEQDLTIGVRILFDTYLGEEKSRHFITDVAENITREQSVVKDGMIRYWVSPDPDRADEIGLQCMTSGEGITIPDKIVFANWKRLEGSRWSYDANTARTFMYPPFSFNDSAVLHYYDPVGVPKGTSREITIVLGNYSAEGYDISGKRQSGDISTLLQQATSVTSEISDLYYSAQADLSTVNKLLETIDSTLESDEDISEEDLQVIEQILSELRERSSEYIDKQE